MKFSRDTATHMLGFLDLPDKISFGGTSKKNNKYYKKHISPDFFVGQILVASKNCHDYFYRVLKVTKKNVLIESAMYRGDDYKLCSYSIKRGDRLVNGWQCYGEKLRCKMERHYKSQSYFGPKVFYWSLNHTTRRIFGARKLFKGEYVYLKNAVIRKHMYF